MRGICFEAVERVRLQTVAEPTIEDSQDAIVEVATAGLCGSDLHPFFGRETGLDVGTVMGHEFVGTVVAVGDAVESLAVGDRVCSPFTTNCGRCPACRRGLTARCVAGQLFGWREQGIGLDGGQAERVRVPWADATLVGLPPTVSDEAGLLVGDNLATAAYCNDLAEVRGGGVYVVVGCGTVGLLSIAVARSRGADTVLAYDPVPARRQLAQRLGATAVADPEQLLQAVGEVSQGRGADSVMELVGRPDAQRLAYEAVGAGGILATIGCHCTPHFAFSPSEVYDKNLTYRSGRCPARAYMPELISLVERRAIDLSWCITHQFPLDDALAAYDTFAHQKDGCIKAVLTF